MKKVEMADAEREIRFFLRDIYRAIGIPDSALDLSALMPDVLDAEIVLEDILDAEEIG